MVLDLYEEKLTIEYANNHLKVNEGLIEATDPRSGRIHIQGHKK